ncbi:AraC family transcriptional regulator [Lysinibacillus cavernae]|uniref:AraC family transcriptional regulator n=1 Tax=Lysinibacillus cavernae TaxID=2666135 RepID=UPI0012D9CD27|nr:AraC family transcriptional regulator [Lysinibacillus cavernae]
MNIDNHILLWKAASIQVFDIRYIRMQSDEQLSSYRVPTSGFLYAIKGKANLLLDSKAYKIESFYIAHVGKGSCLQISAVEDSLEYYLILYKAALPLPHRKSLLALWEREKPFQLQYVFQVSNVLTLQEKIETMHREWLKQGGNLAHFHVKALFYQFVYELLQQLHQQQVIVQQPDLVEQIQNYIEEYYSQPITRESLAQMLNYSVPYIAKQFKQKTGRSIIDYLIHIRIQKAQHLLLHTSSSLQEIASSVGYEDVSYFIRIFKKYSGQTPMQFKQQPVKKKSYRPIYRLSLSNDKKWIRHYIDNDNYYQYKTKGDLSMNKKTKSSMMATLLLCFTLLLSACSGTAITASNNGETKAPANESAEVQSTTKIVSTVKGDVEIPLDPERIVTDYYPGFLLTMGIKPVGTLELYMKSPYLKGHNEGITYFEESLEAVVDLKPDLIITGDDKNYEAYAKIAPTVLIPFTLEMDATLEEFSRILDKEDEVKTWLDDYNQRVAKARQTVQDILGKDQTVTILAGGAKDDITLYGNGYTGRSFYDGLGMTPPAKVLEEIDPEKPWLQLSPELLTDYAGDYIFMAVDKATETYDYKNEPVWKTLDAVQNDQIFEIDGWSFWFSDPISILGQIEEVTEMLVQHAKEK